MPSVRDNYYILRPVMADPPLCTLAELKTILTIDDLADLHEVLNLRDLVKLKSQPET